MDRGTGTKIDKKTDTKTERTAVIVGAGEFTDRGIRDPFDLVIAADGGLAALEKTGIVPDVIVGDFDSLGYIPDLPGEHAASGTSTDAGVSAVSPELFVLPVEKDDTDMAAACRIARERGCRRLRIYGGSGSRPDHFLANLQLAAHCSREGCDVCLVTPSFTVHALTDGTLTLEAEPGTTFSVFSHRDRAEGVSITGGAKYTVSQISLSNTCVRGVSNVMTGRNAQISVQKGTLLIFLYHSPEACD